MNQDKPFVWKSSLGWPVNWLGWSLWGSSRQVKQCYPGLQSLRYGISLLALWGEGLEKGQWLLLSLMPDTSVSPCVPLVPFKLLPWCWSSEGVTLSRWVHVCIPQEELLRTLAVSSTDSIPTGFHSQKLWGLILLALNPGVRGLVWGWDSSLPRYPSQIFIHYTWMWDQPILCPGPSYRSGWMWFLQFHSCQTSIQLNFWCSWVIAVLYFSCNFDVVVQRGEPCLPMPPSWLDAPIWSLKSIF